VAGSLSTQQFGAMGGKIRAGGRPGRSDPRGNSTDRRNRKNYLLSPKAGFGGNGINVPCVHCETPVTYDTVEADRKIPGGTYARSNIQPACARCNKQRSNNESWVPPKAQET